MKKLFLSILSVAIIAGSLFAFTGCNGKDYTSDIDDLKSQIQELEDKSAKIAELEAELAKLKNENASLETSNTDLQTKINSLQSEINKLKNESDLFTGSPKFNYSINETIPYYVSGTKIFDFKVTNLLFYQNDKAVLVEYNVNFSSTISYPTDLNKIFSSTLYDNVTNKAYYNSQSATSNAIIFYNIPNRNKSTLTLYFFNIPFASITTTPTIQ